MKKFIIVLTGLMAVAPYALSKEPGLKLLGDFKHIVSAQKIDWLKFQQDEFQEKFKLMIDHAKEKSTFYKHGLKKLVKGDDADVRMFVLDGIKIAQSQLESWKKFCEDKQKKAQDLYEQHVKSLNEFKQKVERSSTQQGMVAEKMEEEMPSEK